MPDTHIQEVAGRKNFGSAHAIVTTPQPCVMIATWNEDMTPKRTMVESDYLGLVSGNKVHDKVAKAGFTVTPSPNVNAPIINEYPFTLECKVVSFDEGILIGEVINQSADESILTDGQVDLDKLKPLIFDAASMSYRTIGGNRIT